MSNYFEHLFIFRLRVIVIVRLRVKTRQWHRDLKSFSAEKELKKTVSHSLLMREVEVKVK